MEREDMKLSTNERVWSMQIDMLIGFALCMVSYIIITQVDYEFSKTISKFIVVTLWLCFIIQPICLVLFKKSIGTVKTKIVIRNVDGTEASRLKFLFMLIIDAVMLGVVAYLMVKFEDATSFIFIIGFIMANILARIGTGDRTLVDHILGLAAFKIKDVK